jgi:AcrR family transcriptional regulator
LTLHATHPLARRDPERRREEILDATIAVVARKGFANTRVSDVAKELGVSSALIHYHFEVKDVLFAEAFQHAATADLAGLDAAIAREPSPIKQLDTVLRRSIPEDGEVGWTVWIDGWGEALRVEALRRISAELDVRWQQAIEAVIAHGVADGSFRCKDAGASAWRLSALLDGLAIQVSVHGGLLSPEQMLDWVRTAACAELDLPADAFTVLGSRH